MLPSASFLACPQTAQGLPLFPASCLALTLSPLDSMGHCEALCSASVCLSVAWLPGWSGTSLEQTRSVVFSAASSVPGTVLDTKYVLSKSLLPGCVNCAGG